MGNKRKKMRLDAAMVEKGIVESREKAKRLIMAGEVFVNSQKVYKPSFEISEEDVIYVKAPPRYVSRGGDKIESAWKVLKFDIRGKVVCDIGASTGGFTDFMLQNGAAVVYAVDVGKGQLHWKLRSDERVKVFEKVNARFLDRSIIGDVVDFVTCDVSFISVRKILYSIRNILKCNGEFLILVKPQFEAGKDKVKGGIVKDPEVHLDVLKDIIKELSNKGFEVRGLTYSRLRGTKGNIEYFVYGVKKCSSNRSYFDFNIIEKVVKDAFEHFRGSIR